VVGRALLVSVFAFLQMQLSLPKCVLDLPSKATLLGLVCDVRSQKFAVPEAKAQAIIHLIDAFLQNGGSKRELAQLAGKLVAISPAVQLAPLFYRRLVQAMSATSHWEDAVQEGEATLTSADLLYFRDYLLANPGWGWAPRRSVREFMCAGDASESGFGGHSELLPRDMTLLSRKRTKHAWHRRICHLHFGKSRMHACWSPLVVSMTPREWRDPRLCACVTTKGRWPISRR
jgi:hypothetical protein